MLLEKKRQRNETSQQVLLVLPILLFRDTLFFHLSLFPSSEEALRVHSIVQVTWVTPVTTVTKTRSRPNRVGSQSPALPRKAVAAGRVRVEAAGACGLCLFVDIYTSLGGKLWRTIKLLGPELQGYKDLDVNISVCAAPPPDLRADRLDEVRRDERHVVEG